MRIASARKTESGNPYPVRDGQGVIYYVQEMEHYVDASAGADASHRWKLTAKEIIADGRYRCNEIGDGSLKIVELDVIVRRF